MAAPTRSQLEAYARQAALKNGVDPDIFVRQIGQESGFNPNAHNPSGADGIAQLMPQFYPNVNARDPYASLDAAAATMGANLKRNGGDYAKALAAYNAGQGAVDKYGGVPPFDETQSYVSTILGSGGGNTMAQLQDPGGTTVSDADVAALLKKYAGGGSTSSDTLLATGGDGQLYLVNKTTGIGMVVQGVPGQPPAEAKPDDIVLREDAKGVLYLVNLTKNTSTPVTGFPQGTPADKGSGQFNIINDPRTGKPIGLQNDVTGGMITLPPLDEALPDQVISLGTRGVFAIHKDANGRYSSQTVIAPEPNAGDSPTDLALKQSQTAENQANTDKIRQGLRPTAQAALSDAYATVDAINAGWKAGHYSPEDAQAMIEQVHQGLAATLAGTTLYEQQQVAQAKEQTRASAATNLLNQRLSSAASLGNTLFSAATANGGILQPKGGGSWGIDPFAIANQEVNQMGGGQATGDAAASFLAQMLGGGSPGGVPPSAPGGPPVSDEFPTTREAVLAKYPHLAGTAAGDSPPAAQSLPGQVPLTVPPPQPYPITDQLVRR